MLGKTLSYSWGYVNQEVVAGRRVIGAIHLARQESRTEQSRLRGLRLTDSFISWLYFRKSPQQMKKEQEAFTLNSHLGYSQICLHTQQYCAFSSLGEFHLSYHHPHKIITHIKTHLFFFGLLFLVMFCCCIWTATLFLLQINELGVHCDNVLECMNSWVNSAFTEDVGCRKV